MNSEYILFCGIFLIGVIISACAQLMLKKSAHKKADYSILIFIKKHFPSLAEKLKTSNNGVIKLIRRNKKLVVNYLNPFTMSAYAIFIAATFLTIFSYKVIPLSVGPILGATEYFFVAALSRIFLKERITIKKAIGLVVIFVGIMVYSLGDKIFAQVQALF